MKKILILKLNKTKMEDSLEVKNKLTQKFNIEKSDVQIFKTGDYKMFSFDSLNREPKHYGNILESIKINDFTPYNPIMVNPSNEGGFTIIDGQNRFLACKTLKKPIYFVVSGSASIDDAPQLNNASKNWVMNDYIKHYSGKGKYDYMVLSDIVTKYSLPLTSVIRIASVDSNPYNRIKTGQYRINKERDMYSFSDHLMLFEDYISFYKKTTFIEALGSIFFNEGYDKERMINKLKLYSGIVNDQPNRMLMKFELEKLYNYKSLPAQRVKF